MLSIIGNGRFTGQWLWVLVLILLIAPVTSAQTTFSDQIVITNQAISARSVFSADLDGDGDNDVLSASVSDDKIAWYENTDGLGSFGPQQIITTGTDNAVSVFSADLDGDEDNDVLSASYLDDRIAWYENADGLGSFGPQQTITTGANGAHSVFSADLDGDSDNDVLSASRLDDKIAWYENTDGLGSFGPQQVITTAAYGAWSVFSVDLDGDEDNDVLSASAVDDKIAWYRNELYTSVSPGEHHQPAPDRYALHQNHPNPFNPVTTISYDIPVQGVVTVNIYNVLGQKTAELVNGLVNAGQHQLTWNASDVPSGIYFVQMSAGEYRQVRKVVILK